MKANILQKSLIVAGMMSGLVSMSSQAADEVMSFSFETIADVSIAQIQGLDFGADLAVGVNSTCDLLVDSTTNRPGSVDARQGVGTTAIDETATFQTREGDCDPTTSGTTGTAGIYAITGAPGVTVTLSVNPIAPAGGVDFSFIPTGFGVNYVANTADDTLVDIDPAGGGVDIILAAADDISDTGSPIPGQSFVYVGGALTAQRTLTAGTTYNTQTFVIDVVY
jgi:hypothetical protein